MIVIIVDWTMAILILISIFEKREATKNIYVLAVLFYF